jgi:hypothetical protein
VHAIFHAKTALSDLPLSSSMTLASTLSIPLTVSTLSSRINMLGKTQCKFCRKRYSYGGAYISHLRRSHAGLVQFVPSNATAKPRYRLQGDTVELPEIVSPAVVPAARSDDEIDDDDTEITIPITDETSQARTLPFEGAGIPLPDIHYDLDDDEIDPFRPFNSEREYQLARWAVKHHITQAAANDLMAIPGIDSLTSATSAYTLFKGINGAVGLLERNPWKRKLVSFDTSKDPKTLPESAMSAFWYRNPVSCIEFLMQQPAYREEMVYGPIKEFNAAGERMYSEINSGDWWWRMQVSKTIFIPTILN